MDSRRTLPAGHLNHGQDAGLDRFRQRVPGIDERRQGGVDGAALPGKCAGFCAAFREKLAATRAFRFGAGFQPAPGWA